MNVIKHQFKPGPYTILFNGTAIRETENVDSKVLHKLEQGDVVRVVEVLEVGDRLRGRIQGSSKGEGWISLIRPGEFPRSA